MGWISTMVGDHMGTSSDEVFCSISRRYAGGSRGGFSFGLSVWGNPLTMGEELTAPGGRLRPSLAPEDGYKLSLKK